MRDGIHWAGSTKQLQLNNSFKPWVPDWQLTLTSVPKTEITCRLCRGVRFVYTNNGIQVKQITCPHCQGTGRMKGFEPEQYTVSRR